MQDHYQEEISSKENLSRSLNKALGEADMLRVRYEKVRIPLPVPVPVIQINLSLYLT